MRSSLKHLSGRDSVLKSYIRDMAIVQEPHQIVYGPS